MALRPRSYLYVPADRSSTLAKALGGDADVVVADLEDAVPEDRKDVAQANVIAALRAGPPKPLHVRVSADDRGLEHLRALAHSGVVVVRLAKVSEVDDVRRATRLLTETQAPSTLVVACILESALGVENAYEIASADPRVAAIAIGEADLRADLGGVEERGLIYARSRVVFAARAAGLPAPVQSVYVDVRDSDGLRASSVEGRALGFYGRSVIHPRQIAIVHEVFDIPSHERERAQALVDAAERVDREGAFLLEDGRLADPATVDQARALLGEQR